MITSCGVEELYYNSLETDTSNAVVVSTYEKLIYTIEEDIDYIVVSDNPDLDTLWANYDLILTLRISEYFFKSMAYGHFTEDYDADRFKSCLNKAESVREEMLKYFDEDKVTDNWTFHSKLAFRDFDDSRFNYKPYEDCFPDVDAMWEKYIEYEFGYLLDINNQNQ